MQTKLKFALYIINILVTIAIIIGYIYEKHEQLVRPKPQKIHNQEVKKKKIDIETDKGVDTQAVKPVSLGEFKLTAYCPCDECCGKWANNRPNGIVYGAIGEELKEGYSIAVDPTIIPYKTKVIINGNIYKAQDCGGAIKGNRIDVYMEDHDKALEFGVQYAEVFIQI